MALLGVDGIISDYPDRFSILKTDNSLLIHQLYCLFGNFALYLKQCIQLK